MRYSIWAISRNSPDKGWATANNKWPSCSEPYDDGMIKKRFITLDINTAFEYYALLIQYANSSYILEVRETE